MQCNPRPGGPDESPPKEAGQDQGKDRKSLSHFNLDQEVRTSLLNLQVQELLSNLCRSSQPSLRSRTSYLTPHCPAEIATDSEVALQP